MESSFWWAPVSVSLITRPPLPCFMSRPGAGTYVRIRGLVAWAALMQSVALSGLLAAKDSVTPLKAGQLRNRRQKPWVFLLFRQVCEGGTYRSFQLGTIINHICVFFRRVMFPSYLQMDYGYNVFPCLGWHYSTVHDEIFRDFSGSIPKIMYFTTPTIYCNK